MAAFDPDLLAAFARQDDPAYAAALAEEAEYLRWLEEGEPEVDGLAPEDAAVLAHRPLTVKLAAKRERVSERTIMRWLASGELEAHKAGREWRIPPDALDKRRAASRAPQAASEPKKRRRRRASNGKPTAGDPWLS